MNRGETQAADALNAGRRMQAAIIDGASDAEVERHYREMQRQLDLLRHARPHLRWG